VTAQPEEFLGQSPEDFLNQSPEDFLNPQQFANGVDVSEQVGASQRRKVLFWIALAIAAALYAHHRIAVVRLREEQAQSERDLREALSRIWPKIMPTWQKMVIPAVMHSFKLGSTTNLSYAELEALAGAYAEQMGEYVTSTSTEALIEGFNAQLNAGLNPQLAAIRAKEAYGLDAQSMRQAISSFSKGDPTYSGDLVPASVRTVIDRLVLKRAELLGNNEAYASVQMAKALTWQFAYKSGDMPEDAQKMWITAKDERVCPICGPMDRQMVAPDDYFVSGDEKYFAPGVHPRCRCRVQIVYSTQFQKVAPGDPYDRDRSGRFSRNEQRNAPSARRVTLTRGGKKSSQTQRILSDLQEKLRLERKAMNDQVEQIGLLSSSKIGLESDSTSNLSSASLLSSAQSSELSSSQTQQLSQTNTQEQTDTQSSELSSSQNQQLSQTDTQKLSETLSQQLSTIGVEALSSSSVSQVAALIITRRAPSINEKITEENRGDFGPDEADAWMFYDDYATLIRQQGKFTPRITSPGEKINFAELKNALDEGFSDIPENIRPPIIGYRSEYSGYSNFDLGLHEALIDSKEIARARFIEGQAARQALGASGRGMDAAYSYARELFDENLYEIIADDADLTDYDIKSFYGEDAPNMSGENLREKFYMDLRKNNEIAQYIGEQYKLYLAANPEKMSALDLDADLLTMGAMADWLIPMTVDFDDADSTMDTGEYMPTVLRLRSPRTRTGEYMSNYVKLDKNRPVTPMEIYPDSEYEVVSVDIKKLAPDDDLSAYLSENIYKYRIVTLARTR
jgi:hypothetical protein